MLGHWFGLLLVGGDAPSTVPSVVKEVEIDFASRRDPSRRNVPAKINRIIRRVARKAADQRQVIEQGVPQKEVGYWSSILEGVLSKQKIAWDAFYSDLLQKHIDAQITEQIRRMFEINGLYKQIEDDDEQALIMMMMEL